MMRAHGSDDGTAYVVIEPQQLRSGLVGSTWRFVAHDRRANRTVAVSDAFETSGHVIRNSRQAKIALESLISALHHDGWILDCSPGKQRNLPWYAYAFRSDSESASTQPPTNEAHGRPAYIIIRTEQTQPGVVMPHFRFIAVDKDGNVIAGSESFDSGMRSVLDGKRERRALESLMTNLRLDGWILDLTPEQQPNSPWYSYGFRSPDVAGSASPAPTLIAAPRRDGLSIQMMWATTLAVVLILFLICVVLAFSARLEIRPAT